MPGKWISITVEAQIGTAQQVATEMLLNAGVRGVRIDDGAAAGGAILLTSYVSDDAAGEAVVSAIQGALSMLPALGVEGVAAPALIGSVDEEDWANGWKKYFKPIRVGKNLIVTPPWESPSLAASDIPIVIDPGMAFGTGTHPTTQLCLAALEELIYPGDTVADIGTGSGILAIAAVKLGAKSVCAVDNDLLAVRIASENAAVNGVGAETSGEFPAGQSFDIVLANIIADTLIELAGALHSIVKPTGTLVASGIIETREGDVTKAMQAAGFAVHEPRHDGDWVALICVRGAA